MCVDLVSEHGPCCGFWVADIGTELGRDETVDASRDGRVDVDGLSLKAAHTDGGDESILSLKGRTKVCSRGGVGFDDFDAGWECCFGVMTVTLKFPALRAAMIEGPRAPAP